jgi:hypothetical protein
MPRNHGAWQVEVQETRREPNKAERETVLHHVLYGTIDVTVARQQLRVSAGQLLIMPPGVHHDHTVAADTRFFVVCCALCCLDFDDTPRVLALSDDEAAVSWMKDLTVFQVRGNRQREVTEYLLAPLLARLKQIERRDVALRALHPGVAAALQYLDDNIATELTLQDVAAQAHISPSHLRTFCFIARWAVEFYATYTTGACNSRGNCSTNRTSRYRTSRVVAVTMTRSIPGVCCAAIIIRRPANCVGAMRSLE